jgi:hypothetical protein
LYFLNSLSSFWKLNKEKIENSERNSIRTAIEIINKELFKSNIVFLFYLSLLIVKYSIIIKIDASLFIILQIYK